MTILVRVFEGIGYNPFEHEGDYIRLDKPIKHADGLTDWSFLGMEDLLPENLRCVRSRQSPDYRKNGPMFKFKIHIETEVV